MLVMDKQKLLVKIDELYKQIEPYEIAGLKAVESLKSSFNHKDLIAYSEWCNRVSEIMALQSLAEIMD